MTDLGPCTACGSIQTLAVRCLNCGRLSGLPLAGRRARPDRDTEVARTLLARLEADDERWADVAVAFSRAIGGEPHDAGLVFFSAIARLLADTPGASEPRGTNDYNYLVPGAKESQPVQTPEDRP